MRHSWILDVLNDLQSYAQMNDLPAIAAAAAQILTIAEVEIAAAHSDDRDTVKGGNARD